jgi:hypothetical protein
MSLLLPLIYILESMPGQVPGPSTISGAEADFTWADLGRLKGKLVIASDSSWVPAIIGNNIMSTIKYVLNPRNARGGLPLSKGINIQDLYHGHIAIPISQKIPEDLRTKRKNFLDKYNAELEKAFPNLIGSDNPSASQRQAIRQADANTLVDFKALLALIVETFPKASIIYHTYENVRPAGLADDDPRRHIQMPFSGTTPSTGAYFSTYATRGGDNSDVLSIFFLVSPKGEVFLRGPSDASIKGLEF